MATQTNLQPASALLDILSNSTKELTISTNDGYVVINPLTFNFSYGGKFGGEVCAHIIKKAVMNEPAKKLIILMAHIDAYSCKVGGITYSN